MLHLLVSLQAMLQEVPQRLRREDGATAVEYALMVSLIALAIIVAVKLIGTNLNLTFSKVANNLT